MRPLLSCCMIVRDEEVHLPACVAATADIVDEWWVLDTGSVDRTVSVARDLGCNVRETRWRDDFAWARNQVLPLATGTWTLILDADDRLTDCERLRETLEESAEGLPPDARVLAAHALLSRGRADLAVRLLAEGVRLHPNHPDLYCALLSAAGVGYVDSARRHRADVGDFAGGMSSLTRVDEVASALVDMGVMRAELLDSDLLVPASTLEAPTPQQQR